MVSNTDILDTKTENDSVFAELTPMEVDYSVHRTRNITNDYLPELSDEDEDEDDDDDDGDDRNNDPDFVFDGSNHADNDDTKSGDSTTMDEDSNASTMVCKPDEFLFCPQCRRWVRQDCEEHPTNFLEEAVICESIKVDDAEVVRSIPADALIGPVEGRVIESGPDGIIEDDYLWEIDTFSSQKRQFLFPEKDRSHWSFNVIYSTTDDELEPNMYAVQVGGEIYFRVTRALDVGDRLIAYRGDDRRGSHYGRPITKYNDAPPPMASTTKSNPPRHRAEEGKGKHFRRYRRIDGGWQCRRCPFKTSVYSRMRYHAKCAHRSPDQKFVCKICSKSFKHPSSLSTHAATHDENGGRRFNCTMCSFVFRMKHHLRRHESLVHQQSGGKSKQHGATEDNTIGWKTMNKREPIHECPTCHKKFTTKHSRNSHVIKAHGGGGGESNDHKPSQPEPATCARCQKVFKSDPALKVHIAKAHSKLVDEDGSKNGTHVCGQCFKGFPTKSSLNYHEMRHNRQFPFTCQYCLKGYPTLSELRKHQARSKKCAKISGSKKQEEEAQSEVAAANQCN